MAHTSATLPQHAKMRSHVFTDICIVPVQLPNRAALQHWLACVGERILDTRGTKGEGGERTMRNLQVRTGSRRAAQANPHFAARFSRPRGSILHINAIVALALACSLLAFAGCAAQTANDEGIGDLPSTPYSQSADAPTNLPPPPQARPPLQRAPRRRSVGCANRAAVDHREIRLVGEGRLRSLRLDGAKPQ